jgi:hypothetical protein
MLARNASWLLALTDGSALTPITKKRAYTAINQCFCMLVMISVCCALHTALQQLQQGFERWQTDRSLLLPRQLHTVQALRRSAARALMYRGMKGYSQEQCTCTDLSCSHISKLRWHFGIDIAARCQRLYLYYRT